MLEFNYKPLKDPDAYLRRIGYTGSTEPTLENLCALVRAHQMGVPFENLDCCVTKVPISLDIDYLFDKIVTRNRGGYCFELNGLFVTLLRALGYDAWSVFCRVASSENLRPIKHRGNVVRIDGKEYFCDVGLGGGMAPFAVEISSRRQEMFGETYCAEEKEERGWYLLRRLSGKGLSDDGTIIGAEKNVVVFTTLPALNEDFEAYSYQCWAMPDSLFVTGGISVSRRTPTGYWSLKKDVLTVRDGDDIIQTTVPEEEIPVALEKYFDIRL